MDSGTNVLINWNRENTSDSQLSVAGSVPLLQSHTRTCLQPHIYDSRHTFWHISMISPPNNVKNNFQIDFWLHYFSFRHIWNNSNKKSFAHSLLFSSDWLCCYWFLFFLFSLHAILQVCVSQSQREIDAETCWECIVVTKEVVSQATLTTWNLTEFLPLYL